jgi:hypothetical protein
MKRIVRLTESDLARIVKRVINETEAASGKNDPNLGLAQKIVGTIWKAMSGMGTDDQGVLNGVLMIKSKAIYDSVLNMVKTSPKIKTEYGRNFNTVGDWISTDMASYDREDALSLDKATNAIVARITNHLQSVSGNPGEGVKSGGMRVTIDRALRGE